MKICADCEYHKMDRDVGLNQQGQPVSIPSPKCTHPEHRHPVYGTPLACEFLRQETRLQFCGLEARHYKAAKKEEKKPTEGNIITLERK